MGNTGIKEILANSGLDADGAIWQRRFDAVTASDVERQLSAPAGHYSLERLLALISPAAEDYLEEMARIAHQLTIQRFGRTIRLYAPLYLSNYCENSCLYCGFNRETNFKERKRLSVDLAVAEAELIASRGIADVLLVSSEDREFITVDYLIELAGRLRGKFSSISIEIYQMSQAEYANLLKAGIDGVTLYQETYNRGLYRGYHPAGPKSDYDNRLKAPDWIAAAGMREIGLGALLGLADWRVDTLALGEHAQYLIRRYWYSHVSFSFPRLRPAYGIEQRQFRCLLSDKNLLQMILALRLCFSNAGLILSTRERAELRDHLIKLGITKISAGSKTQPGGYSGLTDTVEQFQINDDRNPEEVAAMIRAQGAEPVWKDCFYIDIIQK